MVRREVLMSKKKPAKKDEKKNVLVVRGYVAWGEWVEGYAASKGMPAVVLVDHLLRESAKRDGYPAPPARY